MGFDASAAPIIKYRKDLDGIRAIAVISVIIYHYYPKMMPGGFTGVDIFFVISGYLISSLIFDALKTNSFSVFDFYARRIRRIFPSLITVLLACLAIGFLFLLPIEFKQLGKHIAAGAGFISNFILWKESGYFDNSSDTKPLLHLWSLGIEEQFYILIPVLLWGFWKLKINITFAILFLFLISFFLNIANIHQNPIATFYIPFTRFWELLAGCLLALLSQYNNQKITSFQKYLEINMGHWISIVGIICILYGFFAIHPKSGFPGMWALIPVVGTVLIIFAGPSSCINRYLLSNKSLVWLGVISYPLYLWHWPLLSFAKILYGASIDRGIRLVLILASIVLAWLTYKIIERPLRFGSFQKIKTYLLILIMLMTGLAGFSIYYQEGFKNRFAINILMDDPQIGQERELYWKEISAKGFGEHEKKWVIFGDSQAFDIYKALLHNNELGLKIFQTSYECTSFNLPKKNNGHSLVMCNSAFEEFLKSSELKSAQLLFYTIDWSAGEEPANAQINYAQQIQRIKEKNPQIKIVFLGPKPYLGHEWVTINTITKPHKSIIGMNDYLNSIKWIKIHDIDYVKKLAAQLKIDFLDVTQIFCINGCQFYLDNQFSYFDQNHWTQFGSYIFYKKLQLTEPYKKMSL